MDTTMIKEMINIRLDRIEAEIPSKTPLSIGNLHSLISFPRHELPHNLLWRHEVTEEYHGKTWYDTDDTCIR